MISETGYLKMHKGRKKIKRDEESIKKIEMRIARANIQATEAQEN